MTFVDVKNYCKQNTAALKDIKMDLQEFVNKCENNLTQAVELRESLQQSSIEFSDLCKEILTIKHISNDCETKTKIVDEIRVEKDKTDVEIIRTKQMKAKEDSRIQKLEQIVNSLVSSMQNGISDKDEMHVYQNQLKNYLLRRITGVNLNLEDRTSGKVSGWITNFRTSAFKVFEWEKGQKSPSEVSNFLWEMNMQMDSESYENWNQPELFEED